MGRTASPLLHKHYVPLWMAMFQEDITATLLAEWLGLRPGTLRSKLCHAHGSRLTDKEKAAIAKIFAPKYSYEELFLEERK